MKAVVSNRGTFNVSTLAGALTVIQGGNGSHGAKHTAADIDDRTAGPQGMSRRSCHISEASHHLYDLIHGDAMLIGAGKKSFQ